MARLSGSLAQLASCQPHCISPNYASGASRLLLGLLAAGQLLFWAKQANFGHLLSTGPLMMMVLRYYSHGVRGTQQGPHLLSFTPSAPAAPLRRPRRRFFSFFFLFFPLFLVSASMKKVPYFPAAGRSVATVATDTSRKSTRPKLKTSGCEGGDGPGTDRRRTLASAQWTRTETRRVASRPLWPVRAGAAASRHATQRSAAASALDCVEGGAATSCPKTARLP